MSAIILTDIETNQVLTTIKKYLDTPTANELEMSFGYWRRAEAQAHAGFQPFFDLESFDKLSLALKPQGEMEIKEWYEAIDPNGSMKHILELQPGQNVYQHSTKSKNNLSTLDFKAYEFRIKLNEETEVKDHTIASNQLNAFFATTLGVPYYLSKKRITFKVPGGLQFDLTTIQRICYCQFSLTDQEIEEFEKALRPMTYTVEIEFAKEGQSVDTLYGTILVTAAKTLQLMGLSPFITLASVKSTIIKYAKENEIHLQGAQATNLNEEDIKNLGKYLMTPKVDGTRYFMIILPSGCCYLYQPNTRKIVNTNLCVHKYADAILECELVNNTLICLFDIIRLRRDFRDLKEVQLHHRLSTLKDIEMALNASNPPNGFFKVYMKQFYGQSIGSGLSVLETDQFLMSLPRDGLMFASAFDAYPKKNGPTKVFMKWKPSYTIDLVYNVKDQNEVHFEANKQELVCQQGKETVMVLANKQIKILLAQDEWNQFLHAYPWLIPGASIVEFDVILLPSQQIATLKPMRLRTDKKYPNSMMAIKNNLERQCQPIDIEMLKSQSLLCFKASEPEENLLDKIRGYNNLVKRKGLNMTIKAATETPEQPSVELLDLACGRLGDLSKWKYQGDKLTRVMGIDIDASLLQEAERRLRNTHGGTMQTKVELLQHDLRTPLQLNHTYKIVEINFAIHYFLESEDTFKQFMTNVENHITCDGKLIFTCVDGNTLLSAREDATTLSFCNGQCKFVLTDECISSDALFGRKLVATFGDKSSSTILGLSEQSNEYLVPLKALVEYMCDHYQYEIVTMAPFETLQEEAFEELPEDCQRFVKLNTLVILQKKKKLQVPTTNEESVKTQDLQAAMESLTVDDQPPKKKKVSVRLLAKSVRSSSKKTSTETKPKKKRTKEIQEVPMEVPVQQEEPMQVPVQQEEPMEVPVQQEEPMEEPAQQEEHEVKDLSQVKAKLKKSYKAIKDKRPKTQLIDNNEEATPRASDAVKKQPKKQSRKKAAAVAKEDEPPVVVNDEPETLNKLTIPQLKDILRTKGLKTSARKKADIIKLILESE